MMADNLTTSLKVLPKSSKLNDKTVLKQVCCVYEWSVENFSLFLDRNYEILSPDFFLNSNEGLKFKLLLFRGHCYPKGSYAALRLLKMSGDGMSHAVKYKIFFVNDKGDNVHLQTRQTVFRNYLDYDECFAVTERDLLGKRLLQSGNLTICYEINVIIAETSAEGILDSSGDVRLCLDQNDSADEFDIIPEHFSTPINERMSKLSTSSIDSFNIISEDVKLENTKADIPASVAQDSLNVLSNDFNSLYVSKNFSDIVLCIDGVELAAHKAVLVARSDYFKKLCHEKKNGSKFIISEVNSATMDEVLYYLYTGKTRHLTTEISLDILKAAKTFRVLELQPLIIDFLKDHISVDNVADILQVAEDLNIIYLKQIALEFVNVNHSEVVKSEKWGGLVKSNPHIDGDVMLTIASFQKFNIL